MSQLKKAAKRILPAPVQDRLKRLLNRGPKRKAIESTVTSRKDRSEVDIDRLEDKLWIGYERAALDELESLAHSSATPPTVKARAALASGRWRLAAQDLEEALRSFTIAEDAMEGPTTVTASLKADCLAAMGRYRDALSKLAPLVDRKRADPSTHLRIGSARSRLVDLPDHGSGPLVEALNRLYADHGLFTVHRRDVRSPLKLANLDGLAPLHQPSPGAPLVSVIVPWDSEGEPAAHAVSSLRAQSWTSLEILIVHDEDGVRPTTELQQLMDDSRIRFVSRAGQTQQSPWNVGFRSARGDYLMAHGPDEWSHPQRIETMATVLESEAAVDAVGTSHFALTEGVFAGQVSPRPSQNLFRRRYHSLLVRSTVFEEIGLWDDVVDGADEEFAHRLVARFGTGSLLWLDSGLPLSIVETRQGPTASRLGGEALRSSNQYRQAFSWWHSSSEFHTDLPLLPSHSARPFSVPVCTTPIPPPDELRLGGVVMGDLGHDDVDTLRSLEWAGSQPGRMGVIHIPGFSGPTRPIGPRARMILHGYNGAILCSDPAVNCEFLLLTPSVLRSPPFDHLPSMTARRMVTTRAENSTDSQATAALQHLRAWTGVDVEVMDRFPWAEPPGTVIV